MATVNKRSLILFELPHLGSGQYIEMYLNPQNIQFGDKKLLTEQRVKGGYILQYWGEDLTSVNIQGTTGLAGIEGINVLRDVYRSEQLALIRLIQNNADKRRQSLAQLATSVIMWYDGQGFRGFFTDFNYTEGTAKLGHFDYTINMRVVDIIGRRRQNFMPWHRKPFSTTDDPTTQQEIRGQRKIGDLNQPVTRLRPATPAELIADPEGGLLREEVVDFDPKKAFRI